MADPVNPTSDPGTHTLHSPGDRGQVVVAPGVAQANNVILGAAPGCRLVVSTGVCLGSDVIIQATRGDLIIEPGANLGSGVLVVGRGRIGQHACVGANSTLIDPTLKTGQVVPPNALVGDLSRSTDGAEDATPSVPHHQPAADSHSSLPPASAPSANVYGQKQVHQLLNTLFPHRQALNGVTPENKP